jgi:uncharacterized protein
MDGELQDYVAYRLSRAEGTLNDAIILANNNSWNSCVNRLYYSSFYAVTALLISKGYEAKTHNGVKTIFFREFIATGQIEKEFGTLYSDLIDWRSEGDYADFTEYDSDSVIPMIGKVKKFLESIKSIIYI